jgi:3',5'-cyclic AMP phosphodiesterase CpdA
VCLTGDLTEDGDDEQFVALAEVLHASRFAPYQLSIVPGNHDAYGDPTAWERALRGPLAAFAPTSVGATIDLGDTVIAPMSTMIAQPVTRSAGALDAEQLVRLDALVRDPAIARRTLVVAQHHPPMRHCLPGLQWIDGLLTHATMRALVESAPHAFVLYGHTHRSKDGVLREANGAQAFSAEAVVDSELPLRLYEARDGRLVPITNRVATPVAVAQPAHALAAA